MGAHRIDQKRWDAAMLVVALGIVLFVFYRNTMLASRLVDGTRYFVLDDDMMISMRYGRNLAEGHGLVWNAGDHVEGYTNFLWTIVMAGVHLAGASDARASVFVRLIGFGFLAGTLFQGIRLLRIFAPRSLAVTPAFLLATIMSTDVVVWSSWGFETSMISFFFLTFLLTALGGSRSLAGWVALALIPLCRGDGIHIFAACALVALAVSDARKKTAFRVAIAALPVVVHFVFRRAYYGDWLPNTYYLKVYGLEDVHHRGFVYARNFLLGYPVPVALASGAALAIARRDRRALAFFVLLGSSLAYCILVGGDMMRGFRFLAHMVPVLYAFAALGIAVVVKDLVGRLVWGVVVVLVSTPLIRPLDHLVALDANGDPQEQIQVALLVKKNAQPTSSVAVIAAGIVPYFSRLRAIDLLGKSDKRIARMKPFPGALIAHGKQDPPYSLGLDPDLVVSLRSFQFTTPLVPDTRTTDPVYTFLSSRVFLERYRPNPVANPFLMATTAVYTHQKSPEYAHRQWQPIDSPAPER